jgi:hypothetical protein
MLDVVKSCEGCACQHVQELTTVRACAAHVAYVWPMINNMPLHDARNLTCDAKTNSNAVCCTVRHVMMVVVREEDNGKKRGDVCVCVCVRERERER